MSQQKTGMTYENKLISAKTFHTTNKRQKKERGPKPPTPEMSEESEAESVDSFYTKPLAQVKEEAPVIVKP